MPPLTTRQNVEACGEFGAGLRTPPREFGAGLPTPPFGDAPTVGNWKTHGRRHGSNAGHSSGVAGVDARRATPPGPRLARWGLAGCRQLDPSHPAAAARVETRPSVGRREFGILGSERGPIRNPKSPIQNRKFAGSERGLGCAVVHEPGVNVAEHLAVQAMGRGIGLKGDAQAPGTQGCHVPSGT